MTRSLYALLITLPALGQPAQPKLSFEAVSIKPAEQVTGWIAPIKTSSPVRISYRNYALRKLIMEAYGLARYQVEGPAWIGQDLYDIVANTPRGATSDQTRQMLQSLLAERFHLAFHTEKRNLPAYVLLPGKDTSKLRPEKDDIETPGCQTFGAIAEYADWLADILDKPVVNQTGMSGSYYFFHVVDASPRPDFGAQYPGGAPPPPPPAPPAPPCFSPKAGKMPAPASTDMEAVKEQMGLKLERRANMQVNVLVIDKAGRAPEKN